MIALQLAVDRLDLSAMALLSTTPNPSYFMPEGVRAVTGSGQKRD
jgi:hypothetical protein